MITRQARKPAGATSLAPLRTPAHARLAGPAPPTAIVVVPCFNEFDRLDKQAFLEFAEKHRETRLLLVNDGSLDNTGQALFDLRNSHPDSFLVLDLPRNAGKAEAVRKGMLAAFSHRPRPAYVGYWDADLATPLESIASFRRVLDRDRDLLLVMGSRVALLGRRIDRSPARHLCGRLFATAASLLLGIAVYDTQCGAKLFRADDRTRWLFELPFTSRWIFDVEIVARLLGRHGKGAVERAIHELPLDEWHDVQGSKLRALDFAKAAWELGVIYFKYRWPGYAEKKLEPVMSHR